jgi:hypothetical protein
MENTLVFGNGFNRLENTGISWDNVLDELKSNRPFENKNLPYTLIYERALFEKAYDYSDRFRHFEFNVKQRLARSLEKMNSTKIYTKIAELKLENYITTNYDYCLNQIFKQNFNIEEISHSTEDVYSLRRRTELIDKESRKSICNIWNIHGELKKPATIMLGYDQYVGAMGKLESYLKGTYEYTNRGKKESPLKMEDKLINPHFFDNYSWVDLFFNTNIHIVGLKLDYSEIDIYWLLNKRARLYRDIGSQIKIDNNIIYYTNDLDLSKHELLNSFNVKVVYKKYSHLELYEYAINQLK